MTDLPLGGGSPEPSDRPRYWSGLCLVVYGRGPDSEDTATQIQDQCNAGGVTSILYPIDEVQGVQLASFTVLAVVLPSQLADASATLPLFARLVVDYRARRPEGLESILNGSCEWFNAGVVHAVGRRAIIGHPGMRTSLERVCARHYTDDSGLLDLFQPYTPRRFVVVPQLDEQPVGEAHADLFPRAGIEQSSIDCLWRDVQTWGVTEMRDVPRLRKCIDDCRHYYENRRFSQLYRPLSNIPRNRLDIILDGPEDAEMGTRKTWMENGARVCRHVEKELKKVVPGLARPGRRNKKNVQSQLRRLYRSLRIIEKHMLGSGR